ncbi:MAG: hypothetical protein H5U01_07240, partial [Clostridia bacterium]|nr:hypothetical protein [Clostridia bacterium]
MDAEHMVRRALEIDLEEIRLLAEAARTAPAYAIRQRLLYHIADEVKEAMFWNHHLAHVAYAAPRRPPYDDPYAVK